MKKLTSFLFIFIIFTLFFVCCKKEATTSDSTEFKLATWNIRYLSNGSRDDNELAQIAEIIKRYDLIAIQEARDTEVLERLKTILPGYDYIPSDLVGTEDQKELYTFFFKTSLISKIGTPYLYNDINDDFIREPFIACFKSGNFDFTIINIHVLWGTVTTRRDEIKLLDEVLINVENNNGGEKDIILLGDFNFDRDDSGWQITTHDAIVSPTTKTKIEDTSSYDNIWINTSNTTEYKEFYEIYRFDEFMFSNDDDAASLAVSDHRPVAIILRTDLSDDDSGTGCGTPNDPGSQQGSPDVRIYSVTASPTDAEQVTLTNYSNFTADISNWIIGDKNNPDAYKMPNNTFIDPNGTKTFPRSTLGFGINNTGEIIYLKNDEDDTIDTWSN